MSAVLRRRTTCRLCDGANLRPVLSLAPTPPANAFVAKSDIGRAQEVYPLDLHFCETCTHVQLLDILDPAELFEDYVYVSGTSPVFVKHFEDYASALLARFAPAPGSLAVDIGSNDGTLLKFFKAAGMTVLGIDPARKIAAAAGAAGIETWPRFFTPELAGEIRDAKGAARIVTANNVFAHADDLGGIAAGIADLLDDTGVFVFEVSYLMDVIEKTLFDTIYHEHLAYHSVKPLVGFFAAHGLELFAAERVASHGGSLRGLVQLASGRHRPDGSVAALIAAEQRLGLDDAKTFETFAARIDGLKSELGRMLKEFKTDGASIAAFGAPAKATTLMYHFAIGPEVIDFIIDDSPLKQGLYSPGMHIPVLPGQALYDRRPDYVIILAWNFAQSIIDRHQDFLDAGGHFIVPLPEIELH